MTTVEGYKNEIIEYCKNFQSKFHENEKDVIKPYELWLYFPNIRVGIEFNALTEDRNDYLVDRNYHLNKLEECKKQNVRLIQIFEDEWVNRKEIVLNKIRHILEKRVNLDENILEKWENNTEAPLEKCKELPKIMGRKCLIKEITKIEAKEFLNTYHVQGFVCSSVYLGAFYNDNLIAVMQFKKEISDSDNWELTRFASNYNYVCQGIGGKLFKYFVRNYNPLQIKSFADRRWTVDEKNNIYIQLGFKFDYYVLPDYHYFKESDGIIRQHKFNFRKKILNKKYGLPLTMTEWEMVKELNYLRIYDCGLIKYVWKKEKEVD